MRLFCIQIFAFKDSFIKLFAFAIKFKFLLCFRKLRFFITCFFYQYFFFSIFEALNFRQFYLSNYFFIIWIYFQYYIETEFPWICKWGMLIRSVFITIKFSLCVKKILNSENADVFLYYLSFNNLNFENIFTWCP